jgi:hypothetical protein
MKQFFQEEIKDTKEAITIRKSKDRQHKIKRKKGQTTHTKKKYKRTNNDQQNIDIKLKIE